MSSIIEQLGTRDFPRLRVGIGRPPGRMDPAEYVLQPFDEENESAVAHVVEAATSALESWIAEGIVATMDRYNRPLLGDQGGAGPQGQADQDPCSEGNGERVPSNSAGIISEGRTG